MRLSAVGSAGAGAGDGGGVFGSGAAGGIGVVPPAEGSAPRATGTEGGGSCGAGREGGGSCGAGREDGLVLTGGAGTSRAAAAARSFSERSRSAFAARSARDAASDLAA